MSPPRRVARFSTQTLKTVYHVHDGYYYLKHSNNRKRVFLRCKLRNDCAARASMPLSIKRRFIFNFVQHGYHTHPPDFEYVQVANLRMRIMQRCREEDTPFRQIFDEECGRVSEEVSSRLTYKSLQSSMYRARRYPDSLPAHLTDPDLDQPLEEMEEEEDDEANDFETPAINNRRRQVARRGRPGRQIKIRINRIAERRRIMARMRANSASSTVGYVENDDPAFPTPPSQTAQPANITSSGSAESPHYPRYRFILPKPEPTEFRPVNVLPQHEVFSSGPVQVLAPGPALVLTPRPAQDMAPGSAQDLSVVADEGELSSVEPEVEELSDESSLPTEPARMVSKFTSHYRTYYHVNDGYWYSQHTVDPRKKRFFLRCIRRRDCNCRASMPYNVKWRYVEDFIVYGVHTHEPDFYLEKVANLRAEILRRCREEETPYRQIFDEECARVPEDVASRLEFKKLNSAFYKARYFIGSVPPPPGLEPEPFGYEEEDDDDPKIPASNKGKRHVPRPGGRPATYNKERRTEVNSPQVNRVLPTPSSQNAQPTNTPSPNPAERPYYARYRVIPTQLRPGQFPPLDVVLTQQDDLREGLALGPTDDPSVEAEAGEPTCFICLVHRPSRLAVPCGHNILCPQCLPQFVDSIEYDPDEADKENLIRLPLTCPNCKSIIGQVIPIYL